jgi:DnaJ-class molecular chaperone
MVDGAALAAPVTQTYKFLSYHGLETIMSNEKGPNVKKKQKCKNCEGKGLVKKGDRVVKCQRCGGTGVR